MEDQILKGILSVVLSGLGYFIIRLIGELQRNTDANGELSKNMAVMGEKFEGHKRESDIKIDGIHERLDQHDRRLNSHDKEIRQLNHSNNQLIGVARLHHGFMKEPKTE